MLTDLTKLALSLAGPVARELLALHEAEAAIAVACAEAERSAALLPAGDLVSCININTHLLHQQLKTLDKRQARAADDMARALAGMLACFEPRQRVRAEAHNVNAQHNFVFTEKQVEQLIVHELLRVRGKQRATQTPPPPRRPRRFHGR